jgi:hypothetical protein
MPMYDVECSNSSCKLKEEVYSHSKLAEGAKVCACRLCSSPMHKILTPPRTRRDSWPEGGLTLEHIADKPKHFSSRQELRNYCKQTGLSSGALL